MPGGDKRIFVIIPVYGNWEDTIQCLKILERQTTSRFEVLVADDGSLQPPPAAIHDFSMMRYSRHEHAGFARNCNRAAAEAIGLGATHLLFLNSDTSFGDSFMDRWLHRVAELPHAILSPVIYWSKHPERIWSSGGQFKVFTPFLRERRRFDHVTRVDTVTGCAMVVPVEAWTALGGFDSRYLMYFEDFDLTLRAKRQGIPTYVVPDPELFVRHHVSGSFRRGKVWNKHYLMLTSSLIFIRSHYRGLRKAACLVLNAGHLGLTALISLPELPDPKRLWNAVVCGFLE